MGTDEHEPDDGDDVDDAASGRRNIDADREPIEATRSGLETAPESTEDVVKAREAGDDFVPGQLDKGDGPGSEAADAAVARGAATLVDVLRDVADAGYATQLTPRDDGTVECGDCRESIDPSALEIAALERLEGASDVADMALVARCVCPRCEARCVLTLGYGPNASQVDAAVLDALDLDG